MFEILLKITFAQFVSETILFIERGKTRSTILLGQEPKKLTGGSEGGPTFDI